MRALSLKRPLEGLCVHIVKELAIKKSALRAALCDTHMQALGGGRDRDVLSPGGRRDRNADCQPERGVRLLKCKGKATRHVDVLPELA